jgi:hypothetical protein
MKRIAVLALAAIAAGAVPARAQSPVLPGVDGAKVSEAQRRFQRGVELYKEGDLGGALVEFKRAYELAPTFKILYNLGQVAFQQHDYANALRYFRQYLTDGGNAIPIDRQNEVAGDVIRLEQRVGRLEIETVEPGMEIFVDDVLVGTTPLRAPVPVNEGRRKVDVATHNGEHRTRQIDVAGGEAVHVSFPRLVPRLADVPPPAAERAAPTVAVNLNPVKTSAAEVPAIAKTQQRKTPFPWKSWTLTGLLAGGAAVTGTIAISAKHDLDQQLSVFPGDADEIDYDRRRTRGFALATDGLLIGTAVMTAISLYLTLRDPG